MYNPITNLLTNNPTQKDEPHQIAKHWNPYMDNGGTAVAVCGQDFVVMAADTRLSYGYSIASRSTSKFVKLTQKCALVSSGMQSDISRLHKIMKFLLTEYEFKHKKVPSVDAIHQSLAIILYGRRFFPYYSFNILAGIDDDGKPKVYAYDAVGSTNLTNYGATGSGSIFVTSILDSRLTQDNKQIPLSQPSKLDIIDLVKDSMTSVTERDVLTGDNAEIVVIDASGFDFSSFPLKDD